MHNAHRALYISVSWVVVAARIVAYMTCKAAHNLVLVTAPCATVYLLDELVAEAQQGMQEAGLMVEFCVKRLTGKPPVVKQKVG